VFARSTILFALSQKPGRIYTANFWDTALDSLFTAQTPSCERMRFDGGYPSLDSAMCGAPTLFRAPGKRHKIQPNKSSRSISKKFYSLIEALTRIRRARLTAETPFA
jgi:hypothetical protein